jgi:hypothetical protein
MRDSKDTSHSAREEMMVSENMGESGGRGMYVRVRRVEAGILTI